MPLLESHPHLFMLGVAAAALIAIWLVSALAIRCFAPQRRRWVYVRAPERVARREESQDVALGDYAWSYHGERHVSECAPEFRDYAAPCAAEYNDPATPVEGWSQWDDVEILGGDTGLHYSIWSKAPSVGEEPTIVAVVFRGTEGAAVSDWKANLRWFGKRSYAWYARGERRAQQPPEPDSYRDQYTVVEDEVGKQVDALVADKAAQLGDYRIVVTGHSLGGGLAQYFAFTAPQTLIAGTDRPETRVYAFHSSPVSGWFSVKDKEARNRNAAQLRVYSIFEHGEILAYVRLVCSGWVRALCARRYRVWTFRFNFLRSKQHGIAPFADELRRSASMARPEELRPDRAEQLKLIYDYIKFHIGLFLATPPVLAVLAEGLLPAENRQLFHAGMHVMIGLYTVAGMHAGWFMGTHVNRKWGPHYLDEFEEDAYSPFRRFLHHWVFWSGIAVGLTGLFLSMA